MLHVMSLDDTITSRPFGSESHLSGQTPEAKLPLGASSPCLHQEVGKNNGLATAPQIEIDSDWKAGRQEIIILTTMAILALIIALDATILAPALPTLAVELHGEAIETFWTGTSYLLSYAVCLPFIGASSDIFGRKAAVLSSLFMFTAGTIVCCTANGFPQLLSGRTIQGVGGGGIFVLASIVISDIIPLRQRPRYQSIIAAAWGLGAILGPLIGGLITEHTTWRWLFYVNFPFCAIGLVMVPLFFKLRSHEQGTLSQNLTRVDWLGGGLFIAGTSSLLIGLTWGGVQYPWSSYQAWLPILLGGLVILAALTYEAFVPAEPFIILSVFDSVSASIVFIQTIIQGFILYAQLYYIPFYLTSVKELSSTITGVLLMAVNIILLPSSVGAGVVMSQRGTFVWAIKTGFSIVTLGDGLLIYLNQHRPIVTHVFILLVSGIGHGFLLGSLEAATNAIANPENITHALSMYYFMRSFGLCLGVAIGGTVFGNVFLHSLQRNGIPQAQAIAANSEAFAHSLKGMPDSIQKALLFESYVEGFRGVFYLLVSLAGLATVLAFAVRHHEMDQASISEHRLEKNVRDKNLGA
ncbi:MFS general substrate transporter [Xylariomycetidae sp. FL2044]|nr:MFS general substrate transporter [Xylariomycetidae sp. FL2044]